MDLSDGIATLGFHGVFEATVIGQGGTFTLLLANPGIGMAEREIFSHAVIDFAPEAAHFGFSAGTGGAVTRHIADNFSLSAPAGGDGGGAAASARGQGALDCWEMKLTAGEETGK